MIHIDDYCANNQLTRRTCERYISAGKLPAIKQNGKTYIITPQEPSNKAETISPKEFTSQIKQKAAEGISIEKLLIEVETYEKKTGQKLKGCSYKTLWAISSGNRSVARKERDDKYKIKNPLLKSAQDKLLSISSYLYFQNAQPNLSLTCDLVIQYAQNNEDFYELAAIPKSTLYSYLQKTFRASGFRLLHEFLNHYNTFSRELPTVKGAFTNDIRFFDYIIGDDHKLDIASVLVWDESKKEFISKQLKLWLWVEAVTMYPLGWCIRVGDFTTNDLIQSLTPVLLKYGYPMKAVMVDNGIGRSDEFKNFLTNAGTSVEYSEAYKPTNKSTGERSFGFIKNEHDVFFKNFVGPDKLRESRHSTNKLSPEDAIVFFEEAKNSLESYLLSFYITRPRNRRIDRKQVKISIKEYYEKLSLTFQPAKANEIKIKTASCRQAVKIFKSKIVISKNQFVPRDIIPLCFYNHKVIVKYNLADYSEIYIYAYADTTDMSTGETFSKGDYIATLRNTELDPQRRANISMYNKKLKKALKLAAENIKAISDSEFSSALPGAITANGSYIEKHKEELKDIEAALKNVIPIADINKTSIDEKNKKPSIELAATENFGFNLELPDEHDFSQYPDINDIQIEEN